MTGPGQRGGGRAAYSCAVLGVMVAAACGGEPVLTDAMRGALAAHASPDTWPDVDPARPGQRRRDPRTGLVFVRIEAGPVAGDDGAPAGERRVDAAFWLAETELTVAAWRRHVAEFAGDPQVPVPADERLPMPLSCADAERYCERYGYRLPHEVEWERACRGDDPAVSPWRDPVALQEHAWVHENAGRGARPVATRRPTAHGLHDMLGNLWEWCADPFDPSGARALRGGSWFTMGPTPALRTGGFAGERNAFYGLRPVCGAAPR